MLLTTPRHLQDAHYRFYPALILIFLRSCGQSGLQTGYGAGQHRTTYRSFSEGKRASQGAEKGVAVNTHSRQFIPRAGIQLHSYLVAYFV